MNESEKPGATLWALDQACEELGLGRYDICKRIVTKRHATLVRPQNGTIVYQVFTPEGLRYTVDKPDDWDDSSAASTPKPDPPSPRVDVIIDINDAAGMLEINPLDVPALLIRERIEYTKTPRGKHRISMLSVRDYIDARSETPPVSEKFDI